MRERFIIRLCSCFGATGEMNRGDRREPIFKDAADHRETTVTLGWIAARLKMGSVSMVTYCLRRG